MGLQKSIIKSGIPLSYHCINNISSLTNVSNIIEVSSYIDKEARRLAQRNRITPSEDFDVFINTTFYNIAYDPDMNIVKAYNYLKTLPEFEGAEDDDEEVYLNTIKESEENTDSE